MGNVHLKEHWIPWDDEHVWWFSLFSLSVTFLQKSSVALANRLKTTGKGSLKSENRPWLWGGACPRPGHGAFWCSQGSWVLCELALSLMSLLPSISVDS